MTRERERPDKPLIKNNGVIMLLALAVVAMSGAPSAVTPSATCARLQADFISNEQAFGFTHDLNVKLADADRQLANAVADPKYAAQSRMSQEKVGAEDQTFLQKGDRITTLLLANKCTPPDHVTSWFTYSEKNPNRPVSNQAMKPVPVK